MSVASTKVEIAHITYVRNESNTNGVLHYTTVQRGSRVYVSTPHVAMFH